MEKYISSNNIDPLKVIIVKDVSTEFADAKYKVLNFESFDPSKSYEDIIFNNYKQLFSITVKEVK